MKIYQICIAKLITPHNNMALTKEELMKPRFKVISDYPKTPFEIGEILQYNNNEVGAIQYRNDYPAIFQPLQWWEERTVEEMPEYVLYQCVGEKTEIVRTEKWEVNGFYGHDGWFDAKYLTPSTLEEYNEYKNK